MPQVVLNLTAGRCKRVPAAGGNTFVCTKTFTRKGKKFSAAPEIEEPEDLEPLPTEGASAKDKGGWSMPLICKCIRTKLQSFLIIMWACVHPFHFDCIVAASCKPTVG